MTTVPRWAPRLARLYSVDVRRLEALHAARLSPGTTTWETAVEDLYLRMLKAGPVKGSRLIRRAADYLNSIEPDETCHFVISHSIGSRTAFLMFATFSYGHHPDPAVREEGLNILLHIISAKRSGPSRAVGVPVAYISRHAINRLYERGHDITEKIHATGAFVYIGVLGFLTHRSPRHKDSGLSLLFGETLIVGAQHRFAKARTDGRVIEEAIFDVRTALAADEIGASRAALLEQGRAAADAVVKWLDNATDERSLADAIPVLPRREDSYPARVTRAEAG